MTALEQLDGYAVHESIGHGSAADVYRAEDEKSGLPVALKRVQLQAPESDAKDLKASFDAQAKIESPYVLKCRDFIEREKDVVIAMDLADGGTLKSFVSENPDFFATHPNEFKRAAFQLLSGLKAAHHAGLTHRDVEPGNILLMKEGDSEFPYRLMLSGFGVSKQLSGASQTATSVNEAMIYFAPEELEEDTTCTQKSDIWSLGMVFREMLTGRPPFEGSVSESILKGEFASLLPEVDDGIKELLEAMQQRDPAERKSCEELLELPALEAVEETQRVTVPLREHWDSLPKKNASALQKLGVELCAFLQTLSPGLRDVRPETLTYNKKTGAIGLV